jgi:UDP-N-acetylmuramyl pentapeptide phosphotransferase/UDP-N-acetylglucosamine-1-phosphate transferase
VIVLLAVVVGFLAGRLAWMGLRRTFDQPVFMRRNVRGIDVPTACGLTIVVATLLVEAARVLAGGVGLGARIAESGPRVAVMIVVLGMGLAGLLDDLAGVEVGADDTQGFRGHIGAMVRGRLTTGGIKLLMGIAVALVAVAVARGDTGRSIGRLLVDAALVALAANLGNLLDRAPGRAGKVALLMFAVLAIGTLAADELSGVAVVIGAAAALLHDDIKERAMLGDTGANVLGGVLGLGVVLTCSETTRIVTLVIVVVLNAISERVSFSRVIDAVPPLRYADRAGRADGRRSAS